MDDKTLKESIASLMKDRTKRDALSQLLVEYVQPNHVTPDFVSMLLNSRSLQPGDALVKKVRKGIRVWTLVPGSIPLSSEITTTERMNYTLDGSIVKVGWNQWDMENGEIGTVESIRSEMLAKLKDHFQNKVFTALSTIWSPVNTPSNYLSVGGALTSGALKTAIDYVTTNVGPVRAVVGLRSLLQPITTFGGFWADPAAALHRLDPQLQEIMQTGWLGRWYGAPIIALDQVYNNPDDYQPMLPTDKVLVISQNVGEFITYGDVKSQTYDDNVPVPPYTFMSLYQQYSLMIDNARGIYVFDNVA